MLQLIVTSAAADSRAPQRLGQKESAPTWLGSQHRRLLTAHLAVYSTCSLQLARCVLFGITVTLHGAHLHGERTALRLCHAASLCITQDSNGDLGMVLTDKLAASCRAIGEEPSRTCGSVMYGTTFMQCRRAVSLAHPVATSGPPPCS